MDTRALEEALRAYREGKEGVLITVVNKEGSGPSQVGSRMFVYADGRSVGTIGGGSLELYARKVAKRLIKEKKSLLETYNLEEKSEGKDKTLPMACGGKVTLFYEYIGVDPIVYIFGLGNVGHEVLKLFAGLDFRVIAFDERKEIIENLNCPENCKKVLIPYRRVFEEFEFLKGGYFIIMTHSHLSDYLLVKGIIKKELDPEYIGILASENKAKGIMEKLKNEFREIKYFDKIYSPTGLEIGARTPKEIAISIVSEIIRLRNRIHGLKHKRLKWFT